MTVPELISLLPWWSVLAVAILGAILTLDVTSYAQTWFSQPLPAGVLAGVICGDATIGFSIALPVQLLNISNLPIGKSCSGERTSVILASVLVLTASGYKPPLVLTDGISEEMALLGWVITAVCFGSFFGGWVIKVERILHFQLAVVGIRKLRAGTISELDKIQTRCIAITAARGVILVSFWVAFLVLLWIPMFWKLSPEITKLFAMVPMLTVAVGISSIIELHGRRRGWLLLSAGSVATVVILVLVKGLG
ncbi:MAG: hypothetical protein GY752_02340 [bacterium]|nr:hypothetical protein [bacterium]MCP4799427.1 hypothetical protein [bacterium]